MLNALAHMLASALPLLVFVLLCLVPLWLSQRLHLMDTDRPLAEQHLLQGWTQGPDGLWRKLTPAPVVSHAPSPATGRTVHRHQV